MRVNIETLEKQLRRVTISFDAAEVAKVTDKEATELAGQVRVPGGYTKLAAKISRMKTIHDYRQIIFGRSREVLIEKAAEEGLRELSISTIGRPELDGDAEIKSFSQGFDVVLLVEEMPSPATLVLEGLEFPAVAGFSVTDEDVKKAVDEELDRQTRYENMKEDHQIAKGDLALLHLEFAAKDGSDLGVAPETMSVMVGTERPTPPFQPVLANTIEGRKLAEQVQVEFTWPADLPAAEEKYKGLVGKTFTISLKADYGRTRIRAELNSDFAKEVAGLDSVDQYLALVRDRLETARRSEVEDKHAEAVIEALLAANPMPLPERLFNRYVEDRLGHAQEEHEQRGAPAPTAETRTKVEAEVRRAILKDALTSAIMKLANIEPNRDQIAEKVNSLMGVMDQKNPRFSDMYMNAVAYYTSKDLDKQVYDYVMKLAGGAGAEGPKPAKAAKAKKAKAAEVEAPVEAAAPEAPAAEEAPKAPKKTTRKPKAPAAE